MALDVSLSNIDQMYAEYRAYGSPLSGSLCACLQDAREGIRELTAMRTLKGKTAEAVKSYFGDVHTTFLNHIECLAGQLQSDYASQYMARFSSNPLNENHNARFPEEELTQHTSEIATLIDEKAASIRFRLYSIAQAQVDQFQFSVPSTLSLEHALEETYSNVDFTHEYFLEAEKAGAHAFAQEDTAFSTLQAAIQNALHSVHPNMATYQSGSFFAQAQVSAMMKSYDAAVQHQLANRDNALAAMQHMTDRQLLREEAGLAETEKARTNWELLGLGAGVAVALVGACALVTTGGGIAVVLAAAGVIAAGADAYRRFEDVKSGANKVSAGGEAQFQSSVANNAVVGSLMVASKARKTVPGVGKIQPQKYIRNQISGTCAVVGFAAQAVQLVADYNHDRAKSESLNHVEQIAKLEEQRAAEFVLPAYLSAYEQH